MTDHSDIERAHHYLEGLDIEAFTLDEFLDNVPVSFHPLIETHPQEFEDLLEDEEDIRG